MTRVRRFPSHVETGRLAGDRIVREDADALVAIAADPAIPDEMFPAAFRGPGRTTADVDLLARHWEEHGFGPWTARERESGEVVGRVGLRTMPLGDAVAVEVGWFVARSRWGRGYATELAAEAVRHAFRGLGLRELVSVTLATNTASQAVMRKLGFRRDGEVEHAGLPHLLFRLAAEDAPAALRSAPPVVPGA